MDKMSTHLKTDKQDAVKAIAGLLILVSFLTYEVSDPTLTNLLWPIHGVNNAFGVMGALFSGIFFNWFGTSAFLIPCRLIFLRRKVGKKKLIASLENLFTILIINILISLFIAQGSTGLVEYTGLWGYAANSYLVEFPGRLLSLLLVSGWLIRYANHYQINPVVFIVFGFIALVVGVVSKWTFNKNKAVIKKTNNFITEKCSDAFGSVFDQKIKPKLNIFQFDIDSIKNKIVQNVFIRKLTSILFSFLFFKSAKSQQSSVTSQLFKIRETNATYGNTPVLGDAIEEYERQYGLKGVKYTNENT